MKLAEKNSYAAKQLDINKLILCGLFAAIVTVCSWISLPLPFTQVPINLAILGVLIAGGPIRKTCCRWPRRRKIRRCKIRWLCRKTCFLHGAWGSGLLFLWNSLVCDTYENLPLGRPCILRLPIHPIRCHKNSSRPTPRKTTAEDPITGLYNPPLEKLEKSVVIAKSQHINCHCYGHILGCAI